MKFLSCNSVLLAALYCCMAVTTTTAFSNNMQPRCPTARANDAVVLQSQSSDSDSNTGMQSRARFLSTFAVAMVSAAAVTVAIPVLPAVAGDSKAIDPAIKGTKKDPGYEGCVSQCMYECTKPKGNEQMSRSECLPVCKKQCATTKAQLMVGTPAK